MKGKQEASQWKGSRKLLSEREAGSFPVTSEREAGSFPVTSEREAWSFPVTSESEAGSFPVKGKHEASLLPVKGKQEAYLWKESFLVLKKGKLPCEKEASHFSVSSKIPSEKKVFQWDGDSLVGRQLLSRKWAF